MNPEELDEIFADDGDNVGFVGDPHRILDSKNRIAMPPEYKKKFGGKCFYVICIPCDKGKCLRIYKKEDIKSVVNEEDFASDDPMAKQDFKRYIYSRFNRCELDAQGRFSVEKRFLEFAGIDKEVVLFGVDKRIEMWNPEQYEIHVMHASETKFGTYVPKI